MKQPKTKKPGRNKGKRYEKPISLYPLTVTQAIRILAPIKKAERNSDTPVKRTTG